MGDRLNKETWLPVHKIEPQTYEINGYLLRNQHIAIIIGIEKGLVKTSDLWDIFKHYGDEKKCRSSLKLFLDGDFVWQRPNADIAPFFHDPFTGEEIDWKLIKEAFLKKPLKK